MFVKPCFMHFSHLIAVGLVAALLPTRGSALPFHPRIAIWNAAQMTHHCDAALDALRAMRITMESGNLNSSILDEWNRLSVLLATVEGPASTLSYVSPDRETRDASDACETRLQAFQVQLYQSEPLYHRVLNTKSRDRIRQQYRRDLLDLFDDGGVDLPADKRERAREINERLTTIAIQFDSNIREDATRVTVSAAEIVGLPDSYKAAQKQDDRGNYLLGLTNATFTPFMQYAADAGARKRYWTAKQNQGTRKNIDLLNEAVAMRRELASLHGYPDFARFVMRRRMAGTPEVVARFLAEVQQAVRDRYLQELAELRQRKADDLQQPLTSTRLDYWDVAYYQQQVRVARYNIDQESLRGYFPVDASVAYVMTVAKTLYGIEFTPSNAPTWHPDVRVFDVHDRPRGTGSGAFLGSIYLDLFPRDGKYAHAASWSARPVSTLAKQKSAPGYQTPLAVLATNFDRKGLTQGELELLMHEFGHVLHNILSTAKFSDQAGTNVKRDFLEAPSQMFEEWARRPEVLRLFDRLCVDCPHLTDRQIAQLNAARRYGLGITYARRALYASYDLLLLSAQPNESLASWQDLEGATPLGTVPDTMFPASFDVVGDYVGAYYGYLWSEVLARDLVSGFHGKLLNPVDGRRFRNDVLSQGGQYAPEKLVTTFLGRSPNSAAFFRDLQSD